jgi:hypothetical protein
MSFFTSQNTKPERSGWGTGWEKGEEKRVRDEKRNVTRTRTGIGTISKKKKKTDSCEVQQDFSSEQGGYSKRYPEDDDVAYLRIFVRNRVLKLKAFLWNLRPSI